MGQLTFAYDGSLKGDGVAHRAVRFAANAPSANAVRASTPVLRDPLEHLLASFPSDVALFRSLE